MTRTPNCVPDNMHMLFLGLWQFMSYSWVVVYMGLGGLAVYLEKRMRKAEGNLRLLEDDDVMQRWGRVGSLEGFEELPLAMASLGMSGKEIQALPGVFTYKGH